MILSIFSPLWFLLFAVDAVLVVIITLLLKDKTIDDKAKAMTALAVFNLLYWVLYKFLLSRDPTFIFRPLMELPLHLCNINSILLLVALSTKKPALLNFCYCFGIFGAVMAMVAPDPDFVNMALFSGARGYGYWFYHHILVVQSVLLVTTGFYRPSYREVPKSMVILIVIYFLMYLVNLLVRALTGVPVNYMYTFGLPGNPVLELLHSILPVYPLYLVPAVLLAMPLCMGLVALGRISKGGSDTIHS